MGAKQDKVSISSGNIAAAWHIMHLAEKHEKITVRAAKEIVANVKTSDRSDLLAENGFRICCVFRFISIKNGILILNQVTRNEILPHCSEEIPNRNARRGILKQILLSRSYEWLLFFDEDVEYFKLLIPDQDWLDLLDRAGLFNLEDAEVRDWWQEVLIKYETFGEKKKKEIGDVGEDLTYEHEKARLLADGVEKPKSVVKLAARFRTDFGYDIVSIQGNFFKIAPSFKDKIYIEVKSSVFGDKTSFRFIVSRNEWNTALKSPETYYFYCWLGIDLSKGTATDGPFIVSANSLMPHMPNDNSAFCEWTECRLVLDLNSFSIS